MKSALTARLPAGWASRVDPSWLEGWTPRAFDLPGGHTDVVAIGTGPPLLLLPGSPGFKELWLGVAARLARRFRVVTFDLRVSAGAPDWDRPFQDLERIADQLAPGRAIVIGHSLGGALAQRWALARPDRVRALVLSSSFATLKQRAPGQWRKRYVEQPWVLATQRLLPEPWAAALARRFARDGAWVYDRHCDERLLAFVRFGIRRHSIPVAAACVRLAFAHDVSDALGRIDAPTLVLVGEHDTPWATRAAADLGRRIRGAEVMVSPGASHLHPLSRPEWFCDAVDGWLERRGA